MPPPVSPTCRPRTPVPAGSTLPPRRALIFDGDCGICTWLAAHAARLDRRCAVIPYQDLGRVELAPYGISQVDCRKRLYLLDPWPPGRDTRSRARGGAFAVNAFLVRRFPWTLAVALLYLLPPLLLLEVLVYRWVARYRAAISRRFGLRGCRVGDGSEPGMPPAAD